MTGVWLGKLIQNCKALTSKQVKFINYGSSKDYMNNFNVELSFRYIKVFIVKVYSKESTKSSQESPI